MAREAGRPHYVTPRELRGRRDEGASFSELMGSIGQRHLSSEYLEHTLGLPLHLRFVLEQRLAHGESVDEAQLASIPFYSLCTGLFLPLSMLDGERCRALFGLEPRPPPTAAEREELLRTFLAKPLGLSLIHKLSAILGDAFRGRKATLKRDSLIALLTSMRLVQRRKLIDRLAVVGDVAALYAEETRVERVEPALTAAEVLETLRFLPDAARTAKFALLRSLLERMGKLEAYFLVKLVLRKAGFGFDYQGPLLARSLAEAYGASAEEVAHAASLTDYFRVAEILESEGREGLRKVQLQPLVPIRPALAQGSTDELTRFPVWVERKYDGIRLMLHKSTDALGIPLAGAYTRTRGDWLELVSGLDATIKSLPCKSCIIDGELHGTVFSGEGPEPATVYDVYGQLTGQPARPVSLRYAAFDLIYLDGHDLTAQPLSVRRQYLTALLGPLTGAPLPVPLGLVDGQLAHDKEAVNRLFQHFRNQGYEGVITKDLSAPYRIGVRDPAWLKRKPLVTLDLVLLAGVLAVTTKERAGAFGSYVIGARRPDGGFEDVGDVAGVDVERDRWIQSEIMRDGLLTGRRIERPSASGVRPGLELAPRIVVTVKFEGITRDALTKKLALRDPKIAEIRSDKSALEADTVADLEALSVRERFA